MDSVTRKPPMFPRTRRALGFLARELASIALVVGQSVSTTREMVKFLLRGRLSLRQLWEQCAFVGWDTLGIALVMVTFSAMVIALQVAKEMVKQGAGNYVGALVSIAVLRELAPIMTSVGVIAMAGSAFAAELCTMQISNQVDALRSLQVNPIRYLVLPRVMAGILMIPMMTVVTATAGILAGMVVSYVIADLPWWTYLDSVQQQTKFKDVFSTIFKSGVFGYLIVTLSTTIGIHTRGGAKEVGLATTRAVVWSFLSVAIFDYILTYMIYGSDR